MERWSEQNHVVKGIDPVADAFAGTVRSDVISMKGRGKCTFLIYKGVGLLGTSTITVNACDDFTPSNRTAVPFRYRRCANSADVQGALTAATSAGFTTTAGSSEIYVVEVLAEDLANTGYPNVELTAVEVVNDPVIGAILAIVSNDGGQAIHPTVIS